jgi:hypothetical protein
MTTRFSRVPGLVFAAGLLAIAVGCNGDDRQAPATASGAAGSASPASGGEPPPPSPGPAVAIADLYHLRSVTDIALSTRRIARGVRSSARGSGGSAVHTPLDSRCRSEGRGASR